MAKKKISDAEAEVIKDAIIDALETNEETTTVDTTGIENTVDTTGIENTVDTVASEVVVEAPTVEVTETADPGYYSRVFPR